MERLENGLIAIYDEDVGDHPTSYNLGGKMALVSFDKTKHQLCLVAKEIVGIDPSDVTSITLPPILMPDFPTSGPPVYCGTKDPTTIAHSNGIHCWGMDRQGYLWPQSGTDRFWVLGAGTYDAANTTNWSASSGGAGGASVPAAGENVIVDNNSDVAAANFTITLAANTEALGSFSMTNVDCVATFAVVTFTVHTDNDVRILDATVTFTTGLWQCDVGTLEIGAAGVFGSNSAYTLDCNGAMTLVTTAVFNSPTASGAMTVAGSLTGTTTMTWNQNGVTTILDGATQTLTGFSNFVTTTVLGNLTIQTSTTLTVTGENRIGENRIGSTQDVVLTYNMAGVISNGGNGKMILISTNANPIICTSLPATMALTSQYIKSTAANWNFPASTWNITGDVWFSGTSTTCTFSGNVSITATGDIYFAYDNGGCVYALTTRTVTINSGGTFGVGRPSYTATASITTGTLNLTATSGISVVSGSTLGSNSNYVLDINSSFTNAGTCNLPNATGTCTFSGTTWTETAAITANGGTWVADRAAATTTLGSNATSFYSVTVSNGTTLAFSTYNFTAAGNLIVGGGTSGAVTTSTGTKTITGTTTINASATMTMTTATSLVMTGSLLASAGTLVAPSGTGATAFTFAGAVWNSPTVYTHSSGLLTFNAAGTSTLGNASIQFGLVTINTGATLNTSAASSFAFTAASTTSITGTLTCNASTITAAAVTINNGGLISNMTATTTMSGNLIVGGGASGSYTFTTGSLAASGTVVVNGSAAFGSNTAWTFTQNSTLDNSGTFNAPTGATWTAKGNITMQFISTFNADGGTCTCTTNSFYISENGAGNFYNIIVNANTKTINVEDYSLGVDNNLTVTAGTFTTLDSDAATSRNLTVTAATSITGTLTCNASTINTASVTIQVGGTLNGTTATHTCSGAWNNLGTNTQNGTMVFTDAAHAISGNNTWKHFTISVAAARIITFQAGKTQTFNGNVTLAGAVGQQLSLVSSVPGTKWNFTMVAPAVKTSLTRLTVIDGDASGSDAAYKPITPTNSVDGGGNVEWFSSGMAIDAMTTTLPLYFTGW